MFSGREYFEGSDGPILSILEDSILGKDLELGVAHGSALPDEGSNFVREYLANVPPVPSDGKDKSAQIRKQLIGELIGRL
jgi:hypothetical protein